jgi:hypothetical protein
MEEESERSEVRGQRSDISEACSVPFLSSSFEERIEVRSRCRSDI